MRVYIQTQAHTVKTKFSFVNTRGSRQPTAGRRNRFSPTELGTVRTPKITTHRDAERVSHAPNNGDILKSIGDQGTTIEYIELKKKKTNTQRDRLPPSIRSTLNSVRKPWFTVIDEGGEGSTPDARQWRYIRRSHII